MSLTLTACSNCVILLPSAIVHGIIDRKTVPARVLLDNWLQPNLVTDDFVNKHGFVRRYTHTSLKSNAPGNHISLSSTKMHLQSCFNDFANDMDADVVPQIPYRVMQRLTQCLPDLGSLPLAEWTGTSLNGILMNSPKVQPDLFNTLLRFPQKQRRVLLGHLENVLAGRDPSRQLRPLVHLVVREAHQTYQDLTSFKR